VPGMSYRWKEISDLQEDPALYRDRELEALAQVWEEQKHLVEDQRSSTPNSFGMGD
jgi:hypothetical protein